MESVFLGQQEGCHAAGGFGDDPEHVLAKALAELCGIERASYSWIRSGLLIVIECTLLCF